MVEVTGHLCRQMQVPWNSKGFCHSEAVFSLKFNTMSRIDVRLFGERRTFQEAIVTIVSSKDPTRLNLCYIIITMKYYSFTHCIQKHTLVTSRHFE